MSVLLTHGYFLNEDAKEQEIMRPYPPLGLLYISAFLDQYQVANEVFDSTFQSEMDLQKHMLNTKPNYLGIYVNLMTKLKVLKILDFVRSQQALEDTIVFLGGPDVRHNAEELLSYGADYIVIGEGEESTLALITTLEEKPEQVEEIYGIAYKDEKGQTVINPERSLIPDIDELPLPNRSKIDLEQYFSAWRNAHGQSAISVSTMRGCPYTCKWCSRAVYGLSYRRRSAVLVVQELAQLKKQYNPDSIWFVDDVFTINHRWLKAFAEEIQKQNLDLAYECITRADRMNEEVIDLLVQSGCFRVWIGAESGSQQVIDQMDRRVKVEKVREMIRKTREKGIEAGTFIMLGYPGETESDIEETITHLKQANPDHFTITLAYPIKGTELFEETKNIQTTNLDWSSSTDREIDFERTYSRRYYDYALSRVINEVNSYKVSRENKAGLAAAKLKAKSLIAKAGMQWERIKS